MIRTGRRLRDGVPFLALSERRIIDSIKPMDEQEMREFYSGLWEQALTFIRATRPELDDRLRWLICNLELQRIRGLMGSLG